MSVETKAHTTSLVSAYQVKALLANRSSSLFHVGVKSFTQLQKMQLRDNYLLRPRLTQLLWCFSAFCKQDRLVQNQTRDSAFVGTAEPFIST